MRMLTCFLLFWSASTFAVDSLGFYDIDKLYNFAHYPNFEDHVETAIPGRCVRKFKDHLPQASTLLISLGGKGIEVAPLTFNEGNADFFDELDWHQIFTIFPEVASQFLEVFPAGDLGVIQKKELWGKSKGELKESKHFFIIKAYKQNKFYRYCYYQKR